MANHDDGHSPVRGMNRLRNYLVAREGVPEEELDGLLAGWRVFVRRGQPTYRYRAPWGESFTTLRQVMAALLRNGDEEFQRPVVPLGDALAAVRGSAKTIAIEVLRTAPAGGLTAAQIAAAHAEVNGERNDGNLLVARISQALARYCLFERVGQARGPDAHFRLRGAAGGAAGGVQVEVEAEDNRNDEESGDDAYDSEGEELARRLAREESEDEEEPADDDEEEEDDGGGGGDDDAARGLPQPGLDANACIRRDYVSIDTGRWPNPCSEDYPRFLHDFFLGRVDGHEAHDWGDELNSYKVPADGEAPPSLTAWQAAAYLNAKNAIDKGSRGCLHWWTPGSGKSVMVALLLELLYPKDLDVFVVSTPQNTVANNLDACVRSLLRFSPRFAVAGEPSNEDVQSLVTILRRRGILKKRFMTFRQFTRHVVDNGPDRVLAKAAVIIDEAHEAFNARVCDREVLWGTVLQALTMSPGARVFTFSGTPGRNPLELLMQLELVRGAAERLPRRALLDTSLPGWKTRLASYAAGRVSFVDGTKCTRHFPVDCGVHKVTVPLGEGQVYNFTSRANPLLKDLGYDSFEALASPLSGDNQGERKLAMVAARRVQAAATVFKGGARHGLVSALHDEPNLESVDRFAPKLAALVRRVLDPPNGTAPLETKHFVYSGNQSTITALRNVLNSVQATIAQGDTHLFVELTEDMLAWQDGHLVLAQPFEVLEGQRVFVVLKGTKQIREKLLAAFGRATADGTRHEGLRRPCGKPLVQVIIGSHEANQGITYLRLQHVHLLEPNAKGWNEVVQATGRGVRRDTHIGVPTHMRRVMTHIYVTVNAVSVQQHRAAPPNVEPLERDQQQLARDWQRTLHQLRTHMAGDVPEDPIAPGDDPEENYDVQALRDQLNGLSDAARELDQQIAELEAGAMEMATHRWLKRRGEYQTKLMPTWETLVDEAVYNATEAEAMRKLEVERVLQDASVDALLLKEFHERTDEPLHNIGEAGQDALNDVEPPPTLLQLLRDGDVGPDEAVEDDVPQDRIHQILHRRERARQERERRVIDELREADGPERECGICSETRRRGVKCSRDSCAQFTCAGCIMQYMRVSRENLLRLNFDENDAFLPCAMACGPEPLPEEMWSHALSSREFERAYLRLKNDLNERLHRAEQGMPELAHDTYIIEYIFTTRCPHRGCRQAFFDWDGCCMVTCGCGRNFCSWCLSPLEQDDDIAHDHVRQCQYNLTSDGDLFAEPAEIEDGFRQLKRRQLREYLATHVPPGEEREALLQGVVARVDVPLNLGLPNLDEFRE